MIPLVNEAARGRLITTMADALLHAVVREHGGQWVSVPGVPETSPSAQRISSSLGFTLFLRGTLDGQLRLEISEKDAETLFTSKEDLAEEQLKNAWLTLMEAAAMCMPKRSADAKTFSFWVDSYSRAEIKTPVPIATIQLESAEGCKVLLHLFGDAELVDSLSVKDRGAMWREKPLEPQLDRVIDVPLAVTLRFGQRHMRLREVLELNAGALVELDRKVEEPVDLILDERVIAKGEVVIVDGNYGLRVTEIFERNLLSSL